MAAPDQLYRAVTRIFSVVVIGFGVAILVVTFANGGGPTDAGFWLGLLFVAATLTSVAGGAMFAERGGSASFARHAFDELVSFIAGWAILIDYIIIISLAAISVPHYLGPIWGGFTHGWAEIAMAAAVI